MVSIDFHRWNNLSRNYSVLDDLVGPDDDLSKINVDDDAFDELQAVVNKTMRLKNKTAGTTTEKVRASNNAWIHIVSYLIRFSY